MADQQRLKILFTEGSSISAREILFALGPHHVIDIMDPSRIFQSRYSRFVHRRHRCPSFSRNPKAYLIFLHALLRQENYDVLLPTHEQVYLVARCQELLGRHVGLAVPSFESLHRMQSKSQFVRLIAELDLPQPWFSVVQQHDELASHDQFPCYVKANYSTAGDGVRRVENHAQMLQMAGDFERRGWLNGSNEVVVQGVAKGIESISYAVFQHGRLVGYNGAEFDWPGMRGWALCGTSKIHAQVIDHLRQIGEKLNWHGALFLDYFYDPATQTPLYIECNPRIGGACQAMTAGVNLAQQLVKISAGEKVEPLPLGQEGVRFHQGFLMMLTLALEGANRRQLLAELVRRHLGKGVYANSQDTLTRPYEDLRSLVPSLAISTSLLLNPQSAQRIVKKTVENYSLPESSARIIQENTFDHLELAGAHQNETSKSTRHADLG